MRVLEKGGYLVAVATDGDEGMRMAAEGHLQAVLLGMQCPALKGLDILQRLKKRGGVRKLPLILLLQEFDEALAVQGMQLGAEDFLARKEKDEFAEWAVVHDHYYGTPRRFVDECIARGESVVFDIDVQGSIQIRERYPEAVLIFVFPPSREVLRKRLEGRRTDSPEVVATRMKNALEEITYIDRFDYLVVNDRLERAQLDLESILQAERLRGGRANWQGFLGNDK